MVLAEVQEERWSIPTLAVECRPWKHILPRMFFDWFGATTQLPLPALHKQPFSSNFKTSGRLNNRSGFVLAVGAFGVWHQQLIRCWTYALLLGCRTASLAATLPSVTAQACQPGSPPGLVRQQAFLAARNSKATEAGAISRRQAPAI